jgi:L-lactate dehydrogenase (cytochrome)
MRSATKGPVGHPHILLAEMTVVDRIVNVADARRFARRNVIRSIFDYVDGGAEDDVTKAANERAFRRFSFRPRAGVSVPHPELETTVLGLPVSMPIILAPCGLVQLMHRDGVLGVTRAAHQAGTISALSTFAGAAPEDLASEPGPRWFQLYATDRDMALDLMARASASNFDALVVTMDSPTAGKRDQDIRNGSAAGLTFNARTIVKFAPQVLARPRWLLSGLKSSIETITSGETRRVPGGSGAPNIPKRSLPKGGTSQWNPADHDPVRISPFTWDDVAWIRQQWSGPFIVKSILSAEDARSCVEAGADAVIVSNHGGRQLESTPSSLSVLPEVVAAVGSQVEVLMDGGVRRGGDALKAIALGARAVLIGRPYLYGLMAAGEEGVLRILRIMYEDMARTMVLMGCQKVTDLDPSWLRMEV